MTMGSTGLRGVRIVAASLLVLAVTVTGCARPPDEAWLRFLGFKDGDATLTVLEGELNDGKSDSADAVFSNASVTVGVSGGGTGTGILVKSARVDYRLSGYAPPSTEYPLNLYLGPSSHTNGTATVSGAAEGRTSFPLVPVSLKQWIIKLHTFNNASATPTVKLTANVTFFAETDEGTELEVHGSISIVLNTAGGDGGASTQTVNVSATIATATSTKPGKFAFTRSGGSTNSLTVEYGVTGTATAGSDYSELGNSALISAGSSVASIAVTPLSGSTAGSTVIVTLKASSSYTVGSPSVATVIIE